MASVDPKPESGGAADEREAAAADLDAEVERRRAAAGEPSKEFRAAAEDLKAQSGAETRASLESMKLSGESSAAARAADVSRQPSPSPAIPETAEVPPPARSETPRGEETRTESRGEETRTESRGEATRTEPRGEATRPTPPSSARRLTQRMSAALALPTPPPHHKPIFGWGRLRAALVIVFVLFLVARVALAVLVDYAVDKATRGTLGLSCHVGHSALNLTAGQAVLSDLALVGSSGKTIATIGRAELDLAWTSLPDLIVERIGIEDVELTLRRDATGAIPALAGLGQASAPSVSVPTPTASSGGKPTRAAGDPPGIPRVLLQRMRVNHIRVHWEDETITPTFKGELLLDARGDEIATFPRPQPPSFSLRLAAPGVLDTFRFDVAGRTTEDGVNAFDTVLVAAAHPSALAPYLGKDVEVCARTLSVSAEARANARPNLLDGGNFYTGDVTIERLSLRADDDEIDFGKIVAVFPRMAKDRVQISSISIDRPKLKLGRLANGTLRVLGFGLHPRSSKAPAAANATDAPSPAAPVAMVMPAITIDEIALHGGQIVFQDQTTRPGATIEAELGGSITGVELDPDAPGRRALIKGSGSLPGIADRVMVTGSFVPVGSQREIALDLVAEEIGLTTLAPYLKVAGFEPAIKRGRAHASLLARAVTSSDGSLGFTAEITKAGLSSGADDGSDLMGVRAIRVENGLVTSDGALSIGRVVVDGPHILARRLKSGAIAVAGIRTTPFDPNAPVPPPPTDVPVDEPADDSAPVVAAPAKKGAFAIDEIAVTGASVAFLDEAVAKPITIALDEGAFDLAGLKLGSDHPAAASLRASAKLSPAIGTVSLEGTFLPDPGAPEVSGTLTARDISLKPFSSYLQPLSIDTNLERGRIEGGLFAKARFKGASLADAHVVLSKLALENGTNELGGIDAIELKNTRIDPATHTTNLGDLTISNLRARAYRDATGAISFLGLKLKPKAPATETGPEAASVAVKPAPTAAPKRRSTSILRMGEVALRGAAFTWHDEQTQPPADVRLSRFDLTLGPRRLDEDPRPGDAPVPLKVHAEVDGVSTIDLDAALVLSGRAPTVEADLRMKNLTLTAVAPYLAASGYVPVLKSGTFEGHVSTQLAFDPGLLGCHLELTKVEMRDGTKELLGLDHAQIPFDIDDVGHTFHIGNVAVSGPRIQASRTKEGELVYVGLRAKKPDGTAPVTSASAPAPSTKAPPTALNMDSLRIDGLAVDWKDCQARNAKLELRDGTVEVGRYRPGFKTQTPWKIHADLQDLGVLDMNGTAVIQTRTVVQADLRLTRMKGRDISPYLGEGTTLELEDGSFATKISYSAEPAAAGGQSLSFTSTGMSLEEKGVVHFGWDELKAQLSRNDPVGQVYIVDALELSGLQGELSKLPGGVSRSFGLTRRPVPRAPADTTPPKPAAPAPSEPAPLPTVELRKFAVVASRLTYHDRSAAGAAEPPPYEISDFRFEATQPFVLSGDDPTTAILDLKAGLSVPGVCERAKATFHAIPFDAEPTFRLTLDLAGMNGPEIHKRSPGLSEKYDLSRWQGAQARAVMNFTVKSHGRIDTLAGGPAPLAFELDMDSFDVRSTPGGPLAFGLDDFRMDVTSYDLKTGAMHVKKLELTNPTLPMAKEADGTRLLDVVFKNPPAGTKPPEADPNAPPPAPMTIDRIVLGDGELAWLDETVSPPVDFRMTEWEIDIQGYTNSWQTQKKPMKISIRSRGGVYDDFKIKGQLALAPRLEGDLAVRVIKLQLDKLAGWTKRDYGCDFKTGKFDLEGPWSFHMSHAKGAPTIAIFQPDIDLVPDQPDSIGAKAKPALGYLLDADDKVELKDVVMEFDLDDKLKIVTPVDPVTGQPRAAKWGIGSILSQALGGAVSGAISKIIPGSKPRPVQSQGQKERAKDPVVFAPVESRLPFQSVAELEKLANDCRENPLFFISLRGEVGRVDDARARVLASPSLEDRRDLIARLEADRASLERRRADAASEVRSGLQAGTSDLGVGRAHLTDTSAELSKIDKALENLYEQEREGAERGADRRAREFETELCDNRVEVIAAFLIQRGAPPERVKRRPAKLKPIEFDEGRVSIETYVAARKSADKSLVEQKPGAGDK